MFTKKILNNLETESQTAAPKFRSFISSEPPALPNIDIIPEPKFDRINLELLVGLLNIISMKVIYKFCRCIE